MKSGAVVEVLMVGQHDRCRVEIWSHLQRIKNETVGPDREAVEIYPPADELVDVANIRHLWLPQERMGFGFTFQEGA